MFKKFLAFTMAEVLMVVAIIGVTAALTLPTTTSDLEEKKVVSKVRKVYGELDTAYQAVVAQYGKPMEWKELKANSNKTTVEQQFHNNMLEKLTVSSDIDRNNFILKDGSRVTLSSNSYSDLLTNLGTAGQNGTCTGEMGYFDVDIDGNNKGVNTEGKDRFRFYVCHEEGIVPDGGSTSGPVASSSGTNTAWVIKAGNMDYLKCADSLNWNTKKTCK